MTRERSYQILFPERKLRPIGIDSNSHPLLATRTFFLIALLPQHRRRTAIASSRARFRSAQLARRTWHARTVLVLSKRGIIYHARVRHSCFPATVSHACPPPSPGTSNLCTPSHIVRFWLDDLHICSPCAAPLRGGHLPRSSLEGA